MINKIDIAHQNNKNNIDCSICSKYPQSPVTCKAISHLDIPRGLKLAT